MGLGSQWDITQLCCVIILRKVSLKQMSDSRTGAKSTCFFLSFLLRNIKKKTTNNIFSNMIGKYFKCNIQLIKLPKEIREKHLILLSLLKCVNYLSDMKNILSV